MPEKNAITLATAVRREASHQLKADRIGPSRAEMGNAPATRPGPAIVIAAWSSLHSDSSVSKVRRSIGGLTAETFPVFP